MNSVSGIYSLDEVICPCNQFGFCVLIFWLEDSDYVFSPECIRLEYMNIIADSPQ